MSWSYQRYGTVTDPVHKSHLVKITGDYGCPAQFRYAMDARAAGGGRDDDATVTVGGNTAAGTAAHETIARALTNTDVRDRLLRGGTISAQHVAAVFAQELERETSTRPVNWGKDDPAAVSAERVAMVVGLLNDLHRYVAAVELVEPGFIAACGDYWISGHIDLVYRPRANPDALAIADWKSGATVPSDLVLDHGWEAGVYSAAVYGGAFLPREHLTVTAAGGAHTARCGDHAVTHPSRYVAEREALELALIDMAQRPERYPDAIHFASFPAEIYHVALIHYVPYKRAGKRAVKRPEDLRFYGYDRPTDHKYVAGDRRGPGWLPVRVTADDVPRLQARLRNVVGMIRMGRFIDQVGDKCRRCAWADDCLNRGFAPRGAERSTLERRLRVVDATDAAAAAELSLD